MLCKEQREKIPQEKILWPSHNALLPMRYFIQVVPWWSPREDMVHFPQCIASNGPLYRRWGYRDERYLNEQDSSQSCILGMFHYCRAAQTKMGTYYSRLMTIYVICSVSSLMIGRFGSSVLPPSNAKEMLAIGSECKYTCMYFCRPK